MKSSPMLMALILVLIPVLIVQIPLFAEAGLITVGVSTALVLIFNTILRVIEAAKPVLEQSYRSGRSNANKWFWLG